jgi:hypothetical protein
MWQEFRASAAVAEVLLFEVSDEGVLEHARDCFEESVKALPYFRFGSATACTYCGDTPEGMDHVICVAAQTISRKKSNRTLYGPVAYSCSGCNSTILNSRGFGSFMERCEYVSKRLSKKADPVYWSQRELGQLDYSLRTFIENENRRRLWYRYRSDWFQSRDFFMNIEPLLWQDCLDPTHPKFNQELYQYFITSIKCIKRTISGD